MSNSRAWILVIGILLIVALTGAGIVLTLRSAAQQAVRPVEELSGNLGTQVARVLNPTPTVLPDPITIIHDVRSLSRLETVNYSIEKVITAEIGQEVFPLLFGDKLLLVAHGDVIAGVDLEKIGPQDMWVQGGILHVILPEPEIFVATLDNDKSYVYDRDTGFLTQGDINLETTARIAAENEIERSALEDGILETARTNAENFLSRFFRSLGYPEVIFLTPTPVE